MDATKPEILEWIQKLIILKTPLIVEGKKDKASLNKLGLTNIITIEGPLYQVVEDIAAKHKRVIILTDLDPEGRKLYSTLQKDLSSHGVQIDDKFREFLFKKTKLRQIEGIDTYLEKLS
jgi:5S rRNA maturation endonuclease (ribonuclease M5)